MKKLFFLIILSLVSKLQAQENFKERFAFEISLGPRIPLSITKDDITTGLAIKAGLGYKLSKYFELFHMAIDFGNSSPHNPNLIVIQDYYGGRMAMETVSIIGLPLTTRLHFRLKNSLNGFMGGGGAYYWFSSGLQDPLYGNLQEPRKRHGFGTIFEAGLITNYFSQRWLIILKGNIAFLKTNGNSLSIKDKKDVELKSERTDRYLTISCGIRYLLDW